METKTVEILPFQQEASAPVSPRNFKTFFVWGLEDEMTAEMVSILRCLGDVSHVKVALNYSDVTNFIKDFEPETITLEPHHLSVQGLDALFPIISKKNVPAVFRLTRQTHSSGYFCMGITFRNDIGDYYSRLVPAMKTLIEKACL